nr:uncharacterized mitochondrial protein AtMg00810-like [Tanacetum cinerariifolium]
GSSQNHIDDKGYWDSGCSRHMTGNISYLSDYEPFKGGYVSFGQGGCKITGKGTIKTGKLEFENVYFVKDLKTPRKHNMYSIDLNNIVLHRDLTCLVAKASADECMIWHRRLGKFEAKGDEGYFLGYSMSSKAFRVFNKRTKRVEENLHIEVLENKAIEKGSGLNWLFDIDSLTKSINYMPVVDACTNSTSFLGTKVDARQDVKKDISSLRYIVLPNWVQEEHLESTSSQPQDACNTDAPKSKPKKISDALQDPSWVEAMQEELLQFKTQKSAFFYGTIDEEVYVMQPLGFQDPEYPARVYKVEKAMYGLHQAPRAWYGTLSKYLLTNSFQRGTIDQTLFIRRQRGDFILVQVYVDDIIFRSSSPQLCREFEALMHEKFQMSAMGELNFFFGLQVLQKKDGIFLSQYKYVGDILKKFRYSDVRSSNTPMDKENP